MYAQKPDTIVYEGKEYDLLDVSGNKTLCCMRCVGAAFGLDIDSDCMRGVYGKYAVEDGRLVLLNEEQEPQERVIPHHLLGDHLPAEEDVSFVKTGMLIPFTGFLTICAGGWWRGINYYLDIRLYDEAYELEFDAGRLVGAVDLAGFIAATKAHIKTLPRSEDGAIPLDVLADFLRQGPSHMIEAASSLTPAVPRGRYAREVYCWRYMFDETECVLCSSAGHASAGTIADCEFLVAKDLQDKAREVFFYIDEPFDEIDDYMKLHIRTSLDHMKQCAKYYAPGMKLLSPKNLVDEVREDLRAGLAAYEGGEPRSNTPPLARHADGETAEDAIDCKLLIAKHLETPIREAFWHTADFSDEASGKVITHIHASWPDIKWLAESYAPDVVLVSPKELADEVRGDLRAALAAYEGGPVA